MPAFEVLLLGLVLALIVWGFGAARRQRQMGRPINPFWAVGAVWILLTVGYLDERELVTQTSWVTGIQRHVERSKVFIGFREEIVTGRLRAIRDAENVGAAIRGSRDRQAARATLIASLGYTEVQANHVLDMTLGHQTESGAAELEDELAALSAERDRVEALLRAGVAPTD